MKKTRLLIALLVMLVAASGYAQDSYRQAVKDYLTAVDQFNKSKSLISSMSLLFEKDGQEDVDLLMSRYLDEQFENDMIDWFESVAKSHDMTEADLKEVASLANTQEGKAFEARQQEWMGEFLANIMEPFITASKEKYPPEGTEFDSEFEQNFETNLLSRILGNPVQPKAEIDAAYAAKFNDVIIGSAFGKAMLDAMMQRLDGSTTVYEKQETRKLFKDWMTTSVPAIMLNSAYGILRIEDLDYAAKLYGNEAYCKLNANSGNDLETLKAGHFLNKYTNWMTEHGAKITQNPNAALDFYKSLFKMANIELDDIFNFNHLNTDE